VTITGEAYFEVAHGRQAAPFTVKIRTGSGEEGTVQVLGTHFNINAYGDGASIRTTLLEGSIKFAARGNNRLLRPGEQISLETSGQLEWDPHADTEQAVAWKNGYFNFTRADIRSVMGQLARWYDLQVVYEGEIPERHFAGGLQRSLSLSKVLTILKESDVKFQITGRKITVKF
jgi:ferric-dicitrate binding protein FerR (iron transport regulator)